MAHAATAPNRAHLRPSPLPDATILANRFEIDSLLGQGGFSIGYLARDQRRDDLCVIIELAPEGCARPEDGRPDLSAFGKAHGERLRQMYMDVGRKLSRLNAPSLRGIRAEFSEHGTAYTAVEYVPSAATLERLLTKEGPLDYQTALDVMLSGLTALEKSHAAGLLHLDIRPTSVLVGEGRKVYLIGFGAARVWHEESLGLARRAEDKPYRALEMDQPRLRRGPATDLYGLCAVLYHALTGSPPPDAAARSEGRALVPLASVRSDLPKPFRKAIEAGLAVHYAARPQTVGDLKRLLSPELEAEQAEAALESFDDRAVRLMGFRFRKRQCMACGGILETVRPLRKMACPVCHEGTVCLRRIEPNLCPICRSAPLKHRSNDGPLAICPICKTGPLTKERKRLLSREFNLRCLECEAKFEIDGERLAHVVQGAEGPLVEQLLAPEEWRALSGRAKRFALCDGCEAQFDELPDGRLELKIPAKASRYSALFPGEWARVASGFPPFAGNAECDACGADYDLQGDKLTLLNAPQDPFGFTERFKGRPMSVEDARWLGWGKQSPKLGSVCLECGTEFDEDGSWLRLVQTAHRNLVARIGEELVLEDWHRAAQGLPLIAEEGGFQADFDQALVEAFCRGRAAIEIKRDVEIIWKSRALRLAPGPQGWSQRGSCNLSVTSEGIRYGGLLRKRHIPLDAIEEVGSEGVKVILRLSGEEGPMAFEVPRTPFSAKLNSGMRTVSLGATELAMRLRWQVGEGAKPKSDA